MAILLLTAGAVPTGAQEVRELLGSWIVDGYTFQPGDRSPRGTIAYDGEANVFKGTYVGLKLPKDRPELHAPLPGASAPGIYCGHGQDFSFTSNQDHTCFD